ncbi:MAG: Dam family site-specific DNA-(adenine-N6)-methyltransferase [Candidatus Dojkabacteria bacterium]|nr:MAG: Dam family site-specific DNA-(adenine-N6)-methyltransferase [Candidatus Dojkabacteria bacterium]
MDVAAFGNISKKKIKISQRRYLGSKSKLLEFIEDILKKESVEYKVFADIFGGSGVVAHHFYGRADIIVNDILKSNYLAYVAYFGKGRVRQFYIDKKIEEYNALDSKNITENYFSINFANTYFDRENSLKAGAIRDDIELQYTSGFINNRERAYLITSLIYALDRIANTVGHYDAYRQVTIPKRPLILNHLELKVCKSKSWIYNMDANNLVKLIKPDVIYIDPPYNSRQYSDSYHLLENIAEWKKEPVYGVARKINRSHLKSKYCLKIAGETFSDLIDKIDAKYILVSYNDMGKNGDNRSQSRITDHEIISALERCGDVKIYEKSYKQFTTGRSSKKDLSERIFFCRVGKSPQKRRLQVFVSKGDERREFIKSPLNYTGGKYKLLPQITKFFPDEIETFYDVFCGGANVGINVNCKNVVCIDKDSHVIDLHHLISTVNFDELHQNILAIIDRFGLSHSFVNGYEVYGTESSKGLGQYNKDKYLLLRAEYNKMEQSNEKTLLLLVLIIYAFNNQIRFNSKGDFNLPVGKRDYNGSLRRNLAAFNRAAMEKVIKFQVADFKDILKMPLIEKDFVYLDPPYLLGLASYNENGRWNENHEKKLYWVLDKLNKRGIRFALSNVIEHKGTSNKILKKWIESRGYRLNELDFHYNNSNYQSKAKFDSSLEVLITNY